MRQMRHLCTVEETGCALDYRSIEAVWEASRRAKYLKSIKVDAPVLLELESTAHQALEAVGAVE